MNEAEIIIKKYKGKSGGFATKETYRYSAYLETKKGRHCLDAWQCGGWGYAKKQYALDAAQPFFDLLDIPIKYTHEVASTTTKFEEKEEDTA